MLLISPLITSLFLAMPPGPKAHGSGQDEHSKKILIFIFITLFCEKYFNPAPDEGQYIA